MNRQKLLQILRGGSLLVLTSLSASGCRTATLEAKLNEPNHEEVSYSSPVDIFKINGAYEDYKKNPNQESLKKALELSSKGREHIKKTGEGEFDALLVSLIYNINDELLNIATINNNFDSGIDRVLESFDDEEFRQKFIKKYGSMKEEAGGYVRLKDGKIEIVPDYSNKFGQRFEGYVQQFKSGNFENFSSFLTDLTILTDANKVRVTPEKAKSFDELMERIINLVYTGQLLNAYLQSDNPEKLADRYASHTGTYRFLKNLDRKKAENLMKEINEIYDIIGEMGSTTNVTLKKISQLPNMSEIMATWHTHPSHRLEEYGQEHHPPSGQDLENSVRTGHGLVFAFGQDYLTVYVMKFGKPSILKQYQLRH